MFFFLSKTLDVLVDPFWWAFVPGALGLVLLVRDRRRRLGVGLSLFGLGVLVVFSLPAVSNRLWASLEADAARTMREGVTYDVVVLLGGVVTPLGSMPEEPAWNDNVERLLVTRELLASGRAKKVIVSGGEYGLPNLKTEAAYLAHELEALGVEKDRIILEPRAANTRDNATESAKLITSQGFSSVLIITSAFHMRRSLGCFRAAGLTVDALPVDYRLRDVSLDTHVAPRGEYLAQSTRALREYLGRLTYRVVGYAKESP